MKYYDNKLCATYEEITGGKAPIVKLGTLRTWLNRGLVLYARKAQGRGVKALIDVATLPKEVQDALIGRYGLPTKPKTVMGDEVEMTRDVKALDFYNQHRYQDKDGIELSLPSDLIMEYTLNASTLNTLIQEERRLKMLSNKLNNKRSDIHKLLHQASEELRKEYGHTLPASERRLREKIRQYKKEGYSSLITRAMGNNNSQKITSEGGEYIIALKLSKLPVLSHEEILELYNYKCKEMGWKELDSIQALRDYLYSPAVKPKWYGGVVGELSAYQLFGYKHKTKLPTQRDSLWYIDGTKLNLYYNDGGKLRTVMVVEVIDAYSECFLGYAICDNEDFLAQWRAVCMSLKTAGQRPYEFVHDNQGGQSSQIAREFFDRIAIVHRPTQAHRPQSKSIESVFGRFQKEVLRRCPWFTGANITAKSPESRAKLEWIKTNLNLLPRSREELEEQYVAMREEWNHRLHPETKRPRIEMYQTSVNEALSPLTQTDYEELFLVTRPRSIRFDDSGLSMQSGQETFMYDAYRYEGDTLLVDFEWRLKNIGQDFIVRYNPDDITKVYLYTETKNGLRFERTLLPKFEIARAIQEQGEQDAKWIRMIQKEDKKARLGIVAEQRSISEVWGVGAPSLEPDVTGTTAKERTELDQEVEKRVAEKLKRHKEKGITATPTPKPLELLREGTPLEPAQLQKQESLQTWDDIEIKVVGQSKSDNLLPGFENFKPLSREEIKKNTRKRY